MTKLKNILSEVFDEQPKVDKHEVIESVKGFGRVGQSLYGNGNIMEIAQQLSKIAESAHTHILGESDDWFDKVSVNKNMNFLKGSVKEFKKTAQEAHALNQRLTGLYEDIGHVLNRYYEIDEHMMTEKMDPVGQEDGDIDNDGDTDSSDEYLQNRRDAIGKAMKGETEEQMDELAPGMIMPTIKKGGEWAFNKVKSTLGGRNQAKLAGMKGAAAGAGLAAGNYGGPTRADKIAQHVADDMLPIVQTGKVDVTDIVKSVNRARDLKQKMGGKLRTAEGQETRDEKLLRLAGITKEAIEANKPTKRLSDIKDAGIVTPGAVGGLNKKF